MLKFIIVVIVLARCCDHIKTTEIDLDITTLSSGMAFLSAKYRNHKYSDDDDDDDNDYYNANYDDDEENLESDNKDDNLSAIEASGVFQYTTGYYENGYWYKNYGCDNQISTSDSRRRRSNDFHGKDGVRRQYADFPVNNVAARHSRPVDFQGKRSTTLSSPTVMFSEKNKKHKYIDNDDDDDDDDDDDNRIINNDDDDDDNDSLADGSTPRSGTAGQVKFLRFGRSAAVLGGPCGNTKSSTMAAYPTTTTTNCPHYDNRKDCCMNLGCKKHRVIKVGSSDSRRPRSCYVHNKDIDRRQYVDVPVDIAAARPVGLRGKRSATLRKLSN